MQAERRVPCIGRPPAPDAEMIDRAAATSQLGLWTGSSILRTTSSNVIIVALFKLDIKSSGLLVEGLIAPA